ncbi:hypothetical protein EV1_018740 [Malus domestica]
MLDFDHGSASNDAALDQQICWNSTRNPAERIPDWAGILVSADGRSLSTVAADDDFLVLTREWIESTRACSTGYLSFGKGDRSSGAVKFTPLSDGSQGGSFYGLDVVGISGMKSYPSAPALSILDTCYDFSNADTVMFPKISFEFGGRTTLELDPTGIFYAASADQVCLAFAANGDDGDIGTSVFSTGRAARHSSISSSHHSPSSARAAGQLLPKSDGEQYDPLWDSIEPSSALLKKHGRGQKQESAGDSNIIVRLSENKHKEVETVASATSLDINEFGETADDAATVEVEIWVECRPERWVGSQSRVLGPGIVFVPLRNLPPPGPSSAQSSSAHSAAQQFPSDPQRNRDFNSDLGNCVVSNKW